MWLLEQVTTPRRLSSPRPSSTPLLGKPLPPVNPHALLAIQDGHVLEPLNPLHHLNDSPATFVSGSGLDLRTLSLRPDMRFFYRLARLKW